MPEPHREPDRANRVWNRIRSRPLVRDTVITTAWSTLGKAVGFLIPIVIAAWFRTGPETDALFFAYGLILFFSEIFAWVAESVIVPYIAEARSADEDVGALIGRIMALSGAGILILGAILSPFAGPAISAVTRFDPPTVKLVCRLLLETAPLAVFLVWTSVLSGSLNAYRKFALPAVSPAVRALINVAVIFSFRGLIGIHAVAFGYVAGELGRLVILLGAVQRLKLFRLRFSFRMEKRLREFLRTASYQTVAMAAVWLKPVIDQAMASRLGEGSVSILVYADRIYIIPIAFLCTGLMATTLSHWSQRSCERGPGRLGPDAARAVRIAGPAAALVALALLLLRAPLVDAAFDWGKLSRDQLSEVKAVLTFFLPGLLPYVIARIYFQAHLVLKNTRFLMLYAFSFTLAAIGLNYLLMKSLGVAGIALSTTLCQVGAAVSLRYFLRRKLKTISV